MGNVFKKNKMTEAIEPLAVDLGVDGYVNAVAEKGFTDATKDAVSSGRDNAKQDVKGKVEKAEEVAGFIQDDFNSLKENVSDFYASDEEKQKKKEEEEAKKKAEEEQKKAEEEAAEEYRNMLDRSYILHTACIVCSCAYTNESVNPSYIVVPKSHGEFIHGMPQLTVAAYIANKNVLDIGICRSPKNPAVQEKAREILDEVQEETTADDNTFVVGFDAEFPPYGYKNDDGEYVGFDLDLAQEVCDRNGWILKKQPIEWNSKDMELNSGSISCIWNGFTMNGREDAYTWTTPYVDNSQVVVVRKDSGISQLTDLSGKVVAVQADSSALAALTGEDASEENKALAETFKELQQVGDYNSAFMILESGAVNAICMDIGVANYEIESRGDKFVMLEDRLSSEEYGIGFKKGNTELRDKVQATLLDMLADGTFEKITEN